MERIDQLFFFNQRLTDKLNTIIRKPMTLIEGDTGIGKTTAVNAYLSSVNAKVLWHYTTDGDFAAFYTQFCDQLSLWDMKIAGSARALWEECG